jgi:hypothetical protein
VYIMSERGLIHHQQKQSSQRKPKMFSNVPIDVSRIICDMAITNRNVDKYNEIRTTLWDTIHLVFQNDTTNIPFFVPLYTGSKKNIIIEAFEVDKAFEESGIISTTLDFSIGNEEFVIYYTTYTDATSESCLRVENKNGKFSDVVSDVFNSIFENSIVY